MIEYPGKSAFVEANGLRIHYNEWGEGPVLVWLHGGGPGANGLSNYARNVPYFPDYRNIVFDLPRYGRSDKPVINGSFFTFLGETIATALDGLGIAKASFVGNSLGGATAVRVATLRPDLVQRLILMAPGGMAAPGEGPTEPLKLMLKALGGDPSRENVIGFLKTIVYNPDLLSEELLEERFQAAQNPEAIATAKDSRFGPDLLVPELSAISAPTLLIWGREDAILPVAGGYRAVEALPHAELRVISQCGHWVQYEYPEWFNLAVRCFLSEPVRKSV